MKDKVVFMPADEHQRLLQSYTIILDVCGQACPNYFKIETFAISLQSYKRSE